MGKLKFLSIILISLFISVIFLSNNSYAATVSSNSFLANDKITASELIRCKDFSSIADYLKIVDKTYTVNNKKYNKTYNQIQSFCTDGTYFYVTCLTKRIENSNEAEKMYVDQETTILKINMKKKKIVASAYLGKIGHTNSLAYNNLNNTILIAPCNKRGIVYKISANFTGAQTVVNPVTIELKFQKDNPISTITSIAFNEGRNEYLMKTSSSTIARFNTNFEQIAVLKMKNDKMNDYQNKNSLRGFGDSENDKHVGQSIYADSSYIYALYNVNKSTLDKISNHVAVFDYNGNYVRTLRIPITGFELEEIYYSNGSFYTAGTNETTSTKGFSIFKINIKDTNKFDISYLIPDSGKNSYQSITTGDENHTTKLLNLNDSKSNKTLLGYKAYRDYDKAWLVTVNNETKWLSRAAINQAKKEGKQVKYKLYNQTGSVYHTVKGGNSVLMIAQYK